MLLNTKSCCLILSNKNFLFQMSADFQVPSPLVPARENYFVRYCKKHQEGIWAVVDVSLDHLRPSSSTMARRRPSGCLIQELPNGCSKVCHVVLFETMNIIIYCMMLRMILKSPTSATMQTIYLTIYIF